MGQCLLPIVKATVTNITNTTINGKKNLLEGRQSRPLWINRYGYAYIAYDIFYDYRNHWWMWHHFYPLIELDGGENGKTYLVSFLEKRDDAEFVTVPVLSIGLFSEPLPYRVDYNADSRVINSDAALYLDNFTGMRFIRVPANTKYYACINHPLVCQIDDADVSNNYPTYGGVGFTYRKYRTDNTWLIKGAVIEVEDENASLLDIPYMTIKFDGFVDPNDDRVSSI